MSLLERSFFASIIILVTIVCRMFLINRLPKKVFLILWYVVLFRLLIPYSFSSIFSVYSLAEQKEWIINIEKYNKNIENYKEGVQEQKEDLNHDISKEENRKQRGSVWRKVWLVGMIIFAAVFFISYILCYRKFRFSLPVENEVTKEWLKNHKIKRHISIRQIDEILSPFTYGIFKPVILMPKKIRWENSNQIEYILEHEFIHIKRLDAVTKFIFIIAVCIHWFNPLVWIMYSFVNRDIELSCDETVIRHFGENSKSMYALALIAMEEVKSGMIPLGSGFNKDTEKERIIAIMKIKKNSIISYMLAVILVIGIIVIFAASPSVNKSKKMLSDTNNMIKDKDIKEKEVDIQKEDILYKSVLGEIAGGIAEKGDYEVLWDIAYFLNEEDIDRIAKQIVEKGDYKALRYIYSYISEETLKEIEEQIPEDEFSIGIIPYKYYT